MYKTFRGHRYSFREGRRTSSLEEDPRSLGSQRGFKEMREVTLLKLCETKRFREGGEFHWDEAN
jgi:hypothetical protein